jgi:hypothetical protein
MKKLLSLALAAAMTTIAGASMALPVAPAVGNVCIEGFPAGFWSAHLYQNFPGDCGYRIEWTNPIGSSSVVCDVLERKTITNPSCLYNRGHLVPTTVKSTDNCYGITQFTEILPVTALKLGEGGYGLDGIVAFDMPDCVPNGVTVDFK